MKNRNKNLSSNLKKELIKISKKFNLRLLILFGSRAKGTENSNSDWDFAFISEKNFTINDEIKLHEELMTLVKYEKIDLINIYTSNDLNVINNIFQSGNLIFEKKKGLFFEKKWSAWIDFKDFSHYYKMQSEIINKKLNKLIS